MIDQAPVCLPPQDRYRLLYVGPDLDLLQFIQRELKTDSVHVVRCSGEDDACIFLASEIHYDLLMFDEVLAAGSAAELLRFARSIERRQRTPIVLLSRKQFGDEARERGQGIWLQKKERFASVLKTIRRLLGVTI